jgi:putative membrane protein insertion efficiency factor
VPCEMSYKQVLGVLKGIPNKIDKLLVFSFRQLVRLYQYFISPYLGSPCRFHPHCSNYFLDAIAMHGAMGAWLGFKRILRCHPFARGGCDPVSDKFKL